MRQNTAAWLRLLLGGALLFAGSGTDCTSQLLREASDDLNDMANDIDGENDDSDDIGSFFHDLGDLFD